MQRMALRQQPEVLLPNHKQLLQRDHRQQPEEVLLPNHKQLLQHHLQAAEPQKWQWAWQGEP